MTTATFDPITEAPALSSEKDSRRGHFRFKERGRLAINPSLNVDTDVDLSSGL